MTTVNDCYDEREEGDCNDCPNSYLCKIMDEYRNEEAKGCLLAFSVWQCQDFGGGACQNTMECRLRQEHRESAKLSTLEYIDYMNSHYIEEEKINAGDM